MVDIKTMIRKFKKTAVFNGKNYSRSIDIYSKKSDAQFAAKYSRNLGQNIVLDKNKNGWFLWVGKIDLKKRKKKIKRR